MIKKENEAQAAREREATEKARVADLKAESLDLNATIADLSIAVQNYRLNGSTLSQRSSSQGFVNPQQAEKAARSIWSNKRVDTLLAITQYAKASDCMYFENLPEPLNYLYETTLLEAQDLNSTLTTILELDGDGDAYLQSLKQAIQKIKGNIDETYNRVPTTCAEKVNIKRTNLCFLIYKRSVSCLLSSKLRRADLKSRYGDNYCATRAELEAPRTPAASVAM